jgi:hypothetical protein
MMNSAILQTLTEKMLEKGLISFDEYDKLTALNRQTFSPLYADLLPKRLDISPNLV